MQLFSFAAEGREFSVVLDLPLQLERLVVDGTPVSVKPLGALNSTHRFEHEQLGEGQLSFVINPQEFWVDYELNLNNVKAAGATIGLSDEVKAALQPNTQTQPPRSKFSFVALGGIAFKLLKTVKVVKVALAAATLAVYSIIFTVEFALALIAVLVFHEYGHLRAMKKFGLPTKGMYLIPFFGGIAVGDMPRTQWESLYISMMGPVYGLFMTAVFFVIYLLTGSHFCGLVASVSGLLNLVNLIPVLPLDGGHVVKALVFSRRNYWALMSFVVVSTLCLVLAFKSGFALLSFFIVLGVIDLIAAWSLPLDKDMTPLKTYGIWFSLVWYLGMILAFLGIIVLIAKAGVPGSEIAMKVLQS